jgi:phosphatidylglycerophosphatase A
MSELTQRELFDRVRQDPVHWLAFGFGLGLIPGAPGTFGSLLGIVAWLLIPANLVWQLGFALVGFVAGIWICGVSARRLGVHDHSGIVWDEIVGMYLTLLVIGPEPLWILAAFALFRLFDIWKPWPIRDLDHSLHNGLGIMLDDVMAAIYAAGILVFLQKFIV